MSLAPGDTFDRYRIEAVLGAGGMGRVLRAFDPKLRRRVAIKILHTEDAPENAAQVAMVLHEAQTVAALDHPGVVSVFDVGEASGHPFIVMEYVEGRSLRSLVGKVPAADALRWLTDVARSLAAAHSKGLIHRDIKPENVMVREDGVVKLLDFGIARRVDQDGVPSLRSGIVGVAASTVAGTPCYMAPEQVQQGTIDPRTDQFGWGVLAYEMLSGALPWKSIKGGMSAMVAVVTERQTSLDSAALGLPERVGAVIDRALEKSPSRRFPSMDDLVDALEGSAPTPAFVAPPDTSAGGEETISNAGTPRTSAVQSTEEAPRPPPPSDLATSTGRTERSTVQDKGDSIQTEASPEVLSAPILKPPVPSGRRKGVALAAAAALLVGGAGVWWMGASSSAFSSYKEGLQLLQGGAITGGTERFSKAIQGDPELAAAHLRLAVTLWTDGLLASGRESYAEAARRRKKLNSQDQGLLDALAPIFEGQPPGFDETAQRLIALEKQSPDDAEIPLYRPIFLTSAGRDEEALAAFQGYLVGHPTSATAWLGLALLRARRDELAPAREAVSKCLAILPQASDCLWLGAHLDAHAGQCAPLERSEKSPGTARILATIRPALDGDLLGVDEHLAALPEEMALDKIEDAWLHELRVSLHEEMGDLRKAADLAGAYLARRGRTPSSSEPRVEQIASDPTVIFDGVLLAASRIDRPTFQARRSAWLDAWHQVGIKPGERDLWSRAYAGTARSVGDAQDALRALAPLGASRRLALGHLLGVDAARVFVLAGRAAEAIPLLQEATSSCLGAFEPVRFVQAQAVLGRALELKGDTAGACAAYGAVLARWGKARPRSVSAEESSSRREALRCGPL